MVTNRTPYATERTWVRDKHGRHHWVVVVKATFGFDQRGVVHLADEQQLPLLEPEHFGDAGFSSLRYDADLVAMKPTTDLTVNATAHAPNDRPVFELPVSVQIERSSKQLLVRGQTVYERRGPGIRLSSPEPFTRRPIRYEHSYGGTDTTDADPRNHRFDTRNPVGCGISARPFHLLGRSGPSIFYRGGDPARVGPAGFGALASHWSPRLELAGTYDDAWFRQRRPLLPSDYEDTALLSAPVDQRPARRLRGGEVIVLTNLSPSGSLVLELPKLCIVCRTHFAGRAHSEDLRCALSTVTIEPDEGQLIMVWQSAQAVANRDIDYLDYSMIWEKPYLR
ncbi:DUF2169 domain-containing protein [Pseudenhygromyxa sp. WMMC2535]|uniref:DUF2169 family type VI secretion system accessory protein n=1 Tax=Pseudenhygromyxa sp. WMMC2535 TaxID=2712867 RepID=UPI0020D15F6E|nr:DUF2169 domain-containing protein [Pseudenhygromyxa sp. WMMC2535]